MLRGSAGVSVAGPGVGPQVACARGLVFVLMPREILVLDTELGVPAGARARGAVCAPPRRRCWPLCFVA